MATFVTIEPDAFNNVFADVVVDSDNSLTSDDAIDGGDSRIGLFHNVRRPVRGIQIKDDTYATIQVRKSNGIAIPLFDAASSTNTGKGMRNSNFLIQSISEQRAEKQQIILTFGEPYIFFFGEQPRIINVTGVLLNTEDFNWRAEWWENYDLYLRGTQCVRQKSRVYLAWDDIVVEGYIFQANASEETSQRNLVSFGFQMFLTNYHNISAIGDINAHWEGKDINLDPNSIDLPGEGGTSSTTVVRQTNIDSAALAAGQNSASLFDYLRNGDLGAASTRLVQLQGQLVDFLSLAGQFISGRNIRVPVGFEGAAAFDQDVQVALASIPGASDIVNGPGDRTITFNTGGVNLVQQFAAALGSKFGPARVGLPLSANEDEFIARLQQDDTGAQKFNALFSGQLASADAAIAKVDEIFKQFGIQTDPLSDVTLLLKRAAFGVVQIAGGALVADSSTLRSVVNITGAAL